MYDEHSAVLLTLHMIVVDLVVDSASKLHHMKPEYLPCLFNIWRLDYRTVIIALLDLILENLFNCTNILP